jgi:hypothetical protein
MTKQIGQIGAAIPLKNPNLTETDTWSDTLARGNTSAGNNAVMTSGDLLNHNTTTGKIRTLGNTNPPAEYVDDSTWYIDQLGNNSFLGSWFYASTNNASFGVGLGASSNGHSVQCTNVNIQMWQPTTGRIFNVTTANGTGHSEDPDTYCMILNSNNPNLGTNLKRGVVIGGTGLTLTKDNQALAQILTGKDLIEYVSSATAITTDNQVPHKKYVDDQTDYVEKFGTTFNATANTTWQTVTVTGATANKVIDVLITNTNPVPTKYTSGVRAVGSSLARLGGTYSDSYVATVKTNGSGQIEVYAEDYTKIDFNLYGEHGV